MAKTRVFIDGHAGTTGLRIRERLSARDDLELVVLDEALRKDPGARHEALVSADVAFLCLPDDAAREAAEAAGDADTIIIDTSTAHRTSEGWAYGFPELVGYDAIRASARIANPGCHASGFVALVAPLVRAGIIGADARLSCFSLTGYSGGGKQMIAQYEADGRDGLLDAPRMYGLAQSHKHLPEMRAMCGLEAAPAFCPVVGDFYAGMEVVVPLFAGDVDASAQEIRSAYASHYATGLVHLVDDADEGGFLSAAAYAGRDDMEVSVHGNDERILLVARFDNLGKGASGAAIQNMNIALGLDEGLGLDLGSSR